VKQKSGGLGDAEVSIAAGLMGKTTTSGENVGNWVPGLIMFAQLGLIVPTGAYEADNAVNLGEHRWGFRGSLPFVFTLGSVGRSTTIEFTPGLTIFTHNGDIVGGNTKSQSALGRFEGHLTRDLFSGIYVAADGLYLIGGETFVDGTAQNNKLNTFSLGGTIGYSPIPLLRMDLGYAQHIIHSTIGGRGGQFRVRASVSF
jgi:hypothetical protein